MVVILLYLLSVALLAGGWFLRRHTSPYSRIGGDAYEKKRIRKVIGIILLIAGIMVLILAILTQSFPHPVEAG
jgi:uncharacterized membrane protein